MGGASEAQILNQTIDDKYREMMKFQIQRARDYYRMARKGIPMLSPESRLPVQAAMDCYSQILNKIEDNDYDNLTQRAYVSKEEKLMILPSSWYKTLPISQWLRLPGDDLEP